MPTVARAKFADILLLLKAQLVTSTGIGSEQVRVVARDDVPPFTGSQHLLLRPRSPVPQTEETWSAGRVVPLVRRSVACILRTPLYVDQSDMDYHWLTDTSLGHLQMEEKIVDALVEYFPEDA